MSLRVTEQQLTHMLWSKPKPARRPPALELRTHIALADLLRARTAPGWWWSHIGHGEKRSAATGARLKRMGLKRGIPDFIFIGPNGAHFWLELKRGNSKPSQDQMAFGMMCQKCGIPYALARSFNEAEATLKQWGVL